MGESDSKRTPRWWSGGVCSALAVTVTHPLDLVKVQLQTQTTKIKLTQIINNIYVKSGKKGFPKIRYIKHRYSVLFIQL